MHEDQRRLGRLRRLERMRAIAKINAARDAAEAETKLAQLVELAARTDEMAADYAARLDVTDGDGLKRLRQFAAGLDRIAGAAGADLARAQTQADQRQRALAEAELRRAMVEDRLRLQERAALRPGFVLEARSKVGTGLE